MLWVGVRVSISGAFHAALMVYRLFVFVCLSFAAYFSDGTRYFVSFLFIFFTSSGGRRKEGRKTQKLIFVCCFAYNNVRAFKWRDIYWIIVRLVRCLVSARRSNISRCWWIFSRLWSLSKVVGRMDAKWSGRKVKVRINRIEASPAIKRNSSEAIVWDQ